MCGVWIGRKRCGLIYGKVYDIWVTYNPINKYDVVFVYEDGRGCVACIPYRKWQWAKML